MVITQMGTYLHSEAMAESEVLGELSESTGGTWFHDNHDFLEGI
jgi:hypothetical protein